MPCLYLGIKHFHLFKLWRRNLKVQIVLGGISKIRGRSLDGAVKRALISGFEAI
jgi:hypothetical protein